MTGNQSPVINGLCRAELCQALCELPKTSKWGFTAPPTARFPNVGRQVSARRALAHLKFVLKRLELPGHLHTFRFRQSFISHALTAASQSRSCVPG